MTSYDKRGTTDEGVGIGRQRDEGVMEQERNWFSEEVTLKQVMSSTPIDSSMSTLQVGQQ